MCITAKKKNVILVKYLVIIQLRDYPYYANFMNAVGTDTLLATHKMFYTSTRFFELV